MENIKQIFYLDNLSLIIIALISFIGLYIASFTSRYLDGDSKQSIFYLNLAALMSSIITMVLTDQIFILLILWTINNYFVTRLMLHKHQWPAAKQSAILALKNFSLGSVLLGISLLILYLATAETSIQAILSKHNTITAKSSIFSTSISSLLMLLAVMTQAGLWPFHRWLISSLNSPTPGSAIMHTGLINSGGFLLARFAPILLQQPVILNIIVIVGSITAIIATVWQLMQNDVKRMLACSTISHMGLMVALCGLGLFPAAIAYLCWHGLFKAYLFLASGSAAQQQPCNLADPPSVNHLSAATICGIAGGYIFSTLNTNLFLILLVIVTGTQVALPIIRSNLIVKSIVKIPIALLATILTATIYGYSVRWVEYLLLLSSIKISNPQPLNIIHSVACLALTCRWLAMLFAQQLNRDHYPEWWLKIYVKLLNASQPHPKTVTAHRNHYKF